MIIIVFFCFIGRKMFFVECNSMLVSNEILIDYDFLMDFPKTIGKNVLFRIVLFELNFEGKRTKKRIIYSSDDFDVFTEVVSKVLNTSISEDSSTNDSLSGHQGINYPLSNTLVHL